MTWRFHAVIATAAIGCGVALGASREMAVVIGAFVSGFLAGGHAHLALEQYWRGRR